MNACRFVLTAILVLGPQLTRAQELPTLRVAIHQLLDETGKRCPIELTAPDGSKQGMNAGSARMAQAFNDAICECQPRNARALLHSLPASELSQQISLQEMKTFVLDRLLQPCMGEMFRDVFGGEFCVDVLKPLAKGSLPANFCACMSQEVRGFSDREAMQLGISVARHQVALEKARKDGKPPPARTALMERMQSSMDKCGASSSR